jgi:hypothetical protein
MAETMSQYKAKRREQEENRGPASEAHIHRADDGAYISHVRYHPKDTRKPYPEPREFTHGSLKEAHQHLAREFGESAAEEKAEGKHSEKAENKAGEK